MEGMKTRRIIFVAALVAVLTAALVSLQAWAAGGDLVNGSGKLQAQGCEEESGVTGTCPWKLETNGTLAIFPGEFESIAQHVNQVGFVKKVVFKAEGGKKVVAENHESYGQKYLNLGLSDFYNMTEVDLSGLDVKEFDDQRQQDDGTGNGQKNGGRTFRRTGVFYFNQQAEGQQDG